MVSKHRLSPLIETLTSLSIQLLLEANYQETIGHSSARDLLQNDVNYVLDIVRRLAGEENNSEKIM